MTIPEFKGQYLSVCLREAQILQALNENAEIEPEQKRKNVCSILAILHDALDLCEELLDAADDPAQAQL